MKKFEKLGFILLISGFSIRILVEVSGNHQTIGIIVSIAFLVFGGAFLNFD